MGPIYCGSLSGAILKLSLPVREEMDDSYREKQDTS